MKYNPILSLLLFSSLALLLYYTKNQFSPYFKIALQSFSVTQLKTIAKSTSPNFVFILADDLSWNSIGYENFDLNFTSPTLSSLADHGIRLSNYYAQEVCTPSRASLLTGRYPLSIGMQYGEVEDSDLWGLNLSETTIAEVLQSSGYSTYMIGKWNLGHYAEDYLPTARGFDYYVGYLTGMTYLWSKRSPLATDFLDLVYSNQDCYYPYNGTDLNDYSTYFYRNKAVDIITNHDYDSPMFLYVSNHTFNKLPSFLATRLNVLTHIFFV
jgi:arylsulfatase B/arylsulfatase I/J